MKKIMAASITLITLFTGIFSVLCAAETVENENHARNEYTYADGTTLVTYAVPATLRNASEIYALQSTDIEKSNLPLAKYDAIQISANGQPIEAYATGVAIEHGWFDQNAYTLPQRYTPVAIFDFSGKLEIKIDFTDMHKLCIDATSTLGSCAFASVSPLSRNVQAYVNDNIISFTISQTGNYTVVLNNDEKTAIHILANSIEEYSFGESPLFIENGATVLPHGWEDAGDIVFMPGEYFFGENEICPKTNQSVFLMGGAVVHSNITVANGVSGVKISGKGILDDSESLSWMIDDGIPNKAPINCCYGSSDIDISDITVLNPSLWTVLLNGVKNARINNVHLISGKHNGDGISVQSCENICVTNSFVRSWDDSLVVKNRSDSGTNTISSHNITFKHITLWTDLAQSMEIGYETNGGNLLSKPEIYDIAFEDITVIYNLHKPVISIHNSDNAYVHDITYRNIVVENANMGKGDGADNAELIELSTKKHDVWASTSERGTIKNVLIENLTVLNSDHVTNTVRIEGCGKTSKVENITMKNINICGEKLSFANTRLDSLDILTNKYVRNISIKNDNDTLFSKLADFFARIISIIKVWLCR